MTPPEIPPADAPPATGRPSRRRGCFAALVVVAALAGLAAWEARTSRLQSLVATRVARELTYHAAPGPTDSVVYPVAGPYDTRRGYTLIPAFTDTLLARGFEISRQARFSPRLLRLTRLGLYPAYDEKAQAGLTVLDRTERPIYATIYPERLYPDFDAVPEPVVRTLLYIENRELLAPGRPCRNPAIEWDRLAKAGLDYLVHLLGRGDEMPGGSTLATQIEKYRHTAEGRTSSPKDKLKQMVSATLRAYRNGPNTEAARRDIVLEFVNSVPLAALPGYGEVNGLGDGLWAWYGAEFERTNALLRGIAAGQPVDDTAARAYKQVLSLFIAHRRPSAYLITGRDRLRADADAYLRLLAADGLIPAELRDRALPLPLVFRTGPPVIDRHSFVQQKAANAIRTRLLSLLNLRQLYDLDRVDLTAHTTLDRGAQQEVTRTLLRLKEDAFADSAGLRGDRLLSRGDPAGIIYSFTLYESTPQGNLLRLQADNYDQPLDINEGAKLDLGSTAKLRTLVTYLETVWHLHRDLAGRPAQELRRIRVDRQDAIRRWGIDWLATARDTTLPAMLEAAMDRSYSAGTGERFFTGGGLLTFGNFNKEDNGRVMNLREATRNSVNLVYIRLMRDIVRFYMAEIPGYDSEMYDDRKHPARQVYLERFADKEGKQFLARFIGRYRGKTPAECLEILVKQIRPTPMRLAVIYRSVRPEAVYDEYRSWALAHLPGAPSERALEDAWNRHPKEAYDLADRGYIARVHPLELWLVEYLYRHPDAPWREIVEAGTAERQNVYKWLFRTRYTESQNNRIRVLVEEEAFRKVHESWRRQGYPFDRLVASYATSIGSSADRPAALAELMGILVNDGVRLPTARIQSVHLAPGTPYEIQYVRRNVIGERIYPAPLAQVARAAVISVVESGTARRIQGAFQREDGTVIPVGGKTGTGDHRFETFGRGGRLLESRVVNRTATFVFLVGDRFFGTLTAYVAGPKAAGYAFTSSLPVQILKTLAPALEPLVTRELPVGSIPPVAIVAAAPPDSATSKEAPDSIPAVGIDGMPDTLGFPAGDPLTDSPPPPPEHLLPAAEIIPDSTIPGR